MIELLRKAIYTRLTAGAPLGSVPAFDAVPQGTEVNPPYVFIGNTDTATADTDTSDGADVSTEVHVYSRHLGSKEASRLMDVVRDLFHHYALPVSGCHVIICTAESGDTQTGPDGITREGVVRVRVLLDDIT